MDDLIKDSDYMLTTIDNPFNPHTQFDEWYQYDITKGQDCCGLISRIVDELKAGIDNDLIEDEDLVDEAIERIIKIDPINFCKVKEDDFRYKLSSEEFQKFVEDTISSEKE